MSAPLPGALFALAGVLLWGLKQWTSEEEMISAPHIVESPQQKIAFIRMKTPREQIVHAMQSGLQELGRVLKEQKVAPAGPWFTHHYRRPDESFDFRICFPVESDVKPEGRVEAGELDAARVVQTIYSGGYEGLGSGWGELHTWIAEHQLKTREDLWERYLVGPEMSCDKAEWRTELNRPLA
ncbi:MAG TPA: GyrI-like domain-containing protein [Edaphobacter sp.]|nr:GyrI-like domain-containing protein [Edaphobacter sp.]